MSYYEASHHGQYILVVQVTRQVQNFWYLARGGHVQVNSHGSRIGRRGDSPAMALH